MTKKPYKYTAGMSVQEVLRSVGGLALRSQSMRFCLFRFICVGTVEVLVEPPALF